MTDQQQQHSLARNGGNLPSLRSLYEDEQLLKEVPAIGLAKEVMRNSRQRPVTPYYMDLSPEIAWAFSETLKGALTPLEAMETIEGLFQDVLLASN